MGIDSPRVRWGIHPEILSYARSVTDPDGSGPAAEQPASICFFYPAGFLSKRKPLAEVLKAFRRFDREDARLVVKGQVERELDVLDRAAKRDPRVEVILDDLPTDEHMRLFAAADVCLAPSRWEGLGLHLFEATALGVPILTNDNPPMNEVVIDGVNGLLVPGVPDGVAPRSGIPAFAPDVPALTAALERIADPELRSELAAGARRRREELSWERTKADLAALIAEDRGG
jgi:glycosyltransferase involved in cell wall biosynthesis